MVQVYGRGLEIGLYQRLQTMQQCKAPVDGDGQRIAVGLEIGRCLVPPVRQKRRFVPDTGLP